MKNEDILQALDELIFFAELAEENVFKIRALSNAYRELEERNILGLYKSGEIKNIKGIGKGIIGFLTELIDSGFSSELRTLSAKFPKEILELRKVRGLGSKKIKAIYENLQVASLRELEYACQENRLASLKGFGAKTQENFLKEISFLNQTRGRVLLAQVWDQANDLVREIAKEKGVARVELTGALRRYCETIEKVSVLVQGEPHLNKRIATLCEKANLPVPYEISYCEKINNFEKQLIQEIGPDEFIKESKSLDSAKLVAPELRDLPVKDRDGAIDLIEEKSIKGFFHFHTKASDGKHSLEEMIQASLEKGYEYIGVSEHSETSVYAHGLEPARVLEQKKEIERLQKKYSKIKIFHGIEADIHPDGTIDYGDKILKEFDFVIASIHQGFGLDSEHMTKRLCLAMQNPYVTWIGHISGRLLLGRKGYEFNWDKIVEVAKKTGTSLELNANPYRLDVDWRNLPKLRDAGIKVGIFPDAHSVEGINDIRYGVMMARKGGLGERDVCNTMNLGEISAWLRQKK